MMGIPQCQCADKVDDLLREQGNNESMNLALSPPTKRGEEYIAIPVIETRKDTGRRYTRGKTRLTPNYCPFCGKKYASQKVNRIVSKEKKK